ASPKASVNVIGVNKDGSPVKREEPSLKRMVPLEREVLQQEAEMWASPSPEHGPHIQEDDVQTMKDKETNQMDNSMLIDGVLKQTEWQSRSSGTGVTAEKWPIECLTGEDKESHQRCLETSCPMVQRYLQAECSVGWKVLG
ncbi:hypothetical protein ADUPG1_002579, partial [Aduncisulcus paluster]